MRFGSALETTARAAISSPPGEDDAGDPAVLLTAMRSTAAPVRIVAPAAARRARERSRQRAEAALTSTVAPAPLPSPDAACSSRFAVVPADQGPPKHAVDAARRDDRRACSVGLEPLRREVRDRHRAPAQQSLRVLAAQPPRKPSRARARAGTGPCRSGRSMSGGVSVEQLREHGARSGRASGGTRDSARASVAEKLASSQRPCAPDRRRAQRRRRPGSGANTRGSGSIEARGRGFWSSRSSTTRRAQRAGRVRDGRGPEARDGTPRSRPRRRRSSRRSSTSGFWPASREQRRGGEPVVAAADDDDVGLHATLPASVLQQLEGGEAAGRAHDPAARMRRRAAHVEAARSACGSAPSPAPAAGRRAARGSARPGRCCPR